MNELFCPSHAPLTQFKVIDNQLHINGIGIERLAHRVGRTPF